MVGTPLLACDSKLGAMVALLLMRKMMKREVSLERVWVGEKLSKTYFCFGNSLGKEQEGKRDEKKQAWREEKICSLDGSLGSSNEGEGLVVGLAREWGGDLGELGVSLAQAMSALVEL